MLSFKKQPIVGDEFLHSHIYDQNGFYEVFIKNLKRAQKEIIIESPFISSKRLIKLMPVLQMAVNRGVRVIINTKSPHELDFEQRYHAEQGIAKLQDIGALILFTGGHHRKLAIIDRRILYEGSLNILSQNDSCEIMRRIDSEQVAMQMIDFIGINKFIN
jgi:phosphatidylserine/phosphatidylglycerophosphate/cardiolipin synthase-like enzyme